MGGPLVVSPNSPHVTRTQILLKEERFEELRADWRLRTHKVLANQGSLGGHGCRQELRPPPVMGSVTTATTVSIQRVSSPVGLQTPEHQGCNAVPVQARALTALQLAEAALAARTDALKQRVDEVRGRHAERFGKRRSLGQRQHALWVEHRLQTGSNSVLASADARTRRASWYVGQSPPPPPVRPPRAPRLTPRAPRALPTNPIQVPNPNCPALPTRPPSCAHDSCAHDSCAHASCAHASCNHFTGSR